MAFRTFPRRGSALAFVACLGSAPLAAQLPADYSQQPDPGQLIGGTPERMARCVHQVRMGGIRWDAYNQQLAARIDFAERLPTMSEMERSAIIRRLNLAIASEGGDMAEMQRTLDLLLNPSARQSGGYGAQLLHDYVEESRRRVEDARERWRTGMAECVTNAIMADYNAAHPQPAAVPIGPAAPGDGSWSGTYLSRSYPTTFRFTGGGNALSATFDGRFSDTHNNGSIGNCRPAADGGFDCVYTYRHEDSQKAGQVSGTVHYAHPSRCTIEESNSVVTAVDLKSLDGTPATSPSLYVGARFGGNTFDRQGCS